MSGSCVTGSPQSEFSDRFSNRDEGTEQPEWRCILPRAKHPTQSAGVPRGCGRSQRRIRACYAGRASQPPHSRYWGSAPQTHLRQLVAQNSHGRPARSPTGGVDSKNSPMQKSVKPTDKPDSVASQAPESAQKVTAINLGHWSPNGSVLPTRQLRGPRS